MNVVVFGVGVWLGGWVGGGFEGRIQLCVCTFSPGQRARPAPTCPIGVLSEKVEPRK